MTSNGKAAEAGSVLNRGVDREDARATQAGLLEGVFHAYVGHLSFLLRPGKYYRECVKEGERSVGKGKSIAARSENAP